MLKLIQKSLAVFCLVFFAYDVAAEDGNISQERDKKIAAVIEDQIAAFKAQDGERAFSHASPRIKSMFQSAKRFNFMVKRTYGMIYSPEFYQLEELRDVDGVLLQTAIFVSEGQQTVRAVYEMQLQEDGTWKINGVFVHELDDQVT